MRIIWVINIVLPIIAKRYNLPPNQGGGWIFGALTSISSQNDNELVVCFPVPYKNQINVVIEKTHYYSFYYNFRMMDKYPKYLESEFFLLLSKFNPEIIHIWGTEAPYANVMVNAAKKAGINNRVIISLQGICSIISKHYLAGIPFSFHRRKTFRDLLRNDNLAKQKNLYAKRGLFERDSINKCNHVIGRTTFDKACSLQINSNLQYHHCNESLRDLFYNEKWELSKCERHTIFVSQGSSPLKGLHFILEALPIIRKKFPTVQLFISGHDVTYSSKKTDLFRLTSYGFYINSLIKKNDISSNITFLGVLNEKEIVARYLQSHVFVSPSTIENSSNSICEAMLLGVPVVASNVGGVQDLLKHNEEGFLYQFDATYMLAYYICQLFANDEIASKFSQNSRKTAIKTHDKGINNSVLLNIYKDVLNC